MKVFLLLLSLVLCLSVTAQEIEKVNALPKFLNESSALEVIAGKLWTLNDGGGANQLYQLDTLGNMTRSITIMDVVNRDWEELAVDDRGSMYIGEFGNNLNTFDTLHIYRISNPEESSSDSFPAEKISFRYEDQYSYPPSQDSLNFDCEAMLWHQDSIYLFSKHRTFPMSTNLYVLPATPGFHLAKKRGTFLTGNPTGLEHALYSYWITAADISPDGSRVAILSGNKMWVFYDFPGKDFLKGKHVIIPLKPNTQKEALVFYDNDTIYITDEILDLKVKKVGGNIYKINIKPWME